MGAFGVSLALAGSFLGGQQVLDPMELTAQSRISFYRVQHADPYVLVMLLRGESPPYPEISTAAPFGVGAQQAQNAPGTWLIPEGTLTVNPIDNTIWFIPKR